jgi:hypothetical protein
VIENEGRTEEEWNLHSFNQLAMEWAMVGRRDARSHDPKPLVGHHDPCATRSTLLQLLWFIAMRLLPLDSKEHHDRSGASIRGG